MNKREAVTQVIPRSAVNNIANIEDDDIKPVEKAKKIEIFKPRRQDSLPYGNCKVKMMGKYKVRKRNNGYNIQLHDEFGVTKEVFDVWKSESLDRAFEKGSIDPFISCAQSDNQKRSKRNQKAQHKDMLRKIQRRFRSSSERL